MYWYVASTKTFSMNPENRTCTYANLVSSTATVPVVRISSWTCFRSTSPVFTPMLCNLCAEICTGTKEVSADAGGAPDDCSVETCAVVFADGVSALITGSPNGYAPHRATRN